MRTSGSGLGSGLPESGHGWAIYESTPWRHSMPKFASERAAQCCELRNRDTSYGLGIPSLRSTVRRLHSVASSMRPQMRSSMSRSTMCGSVLNQLRPELPF